MEYYNQLDDSWLRKLTKFNYDAWRNAGKIANRYHYRATKAKINYAVNLRRLMTDSERAFFFRYISKLDAIIATQVVICGYIVDFLIPDHKIVIEIDGESHQDRKEYDAKRDQVLSGLGYTVLRFTNEEIGKTLDVVLDNLREITGIEARKKEIAKQEYKPLPSTKKYRKRLEDFW